MDGERNICDLFVIMICMKGNECLFKGLFWIVLGLF